MIKRGDIFPTEGIKYGVSKQYGPWAMLKAIDDRKCHLPITIFFTNPQEIKGAECVRIAEILTSDLKLIRYQGRAISINIVAVVGEGVEFREDNMGRVSTPEEDVAALFGL